MTSNDPVWYIPSPTTPLVLVSFRLPHMALSVYGRNQKISKRKTSSKTDISSPFFKIVFPSPLFLLFVKALMCTFSYYGTFPTSMSILANDEVREGGWDADTENCEKGSHYLYSVRNLHWQTLKDSTCWQDNGRQAQVVLVTIILYQVVRYHFVYICNHHTQTFIPWTTNTTQKSVILTKINISANTNTKFMMSIP